MDIKGFTGRLRTKDVFGPEGGMGD